MSSTAGHWNTARAGKRSITENKPFSPFAKKRVTPTKQEGKRQKAKPAHPLEENLEALEHDMLSIIEQAPAAGAHDGITANTDAPANPSSTIEDANDPDDSFLDRDPDVLAAIQAQNQASAELIAHREAVKAKYLADIRIKTAELVSLKKKSFTSGPTPFSTGAATLNPHRPLYRARQPALTAGNRSNAPLPSPHDYESNFDTSHLDTLSLNAQVIHENLQCREHPPRTQPTHNRALPPFTGKGSTGGQAYPSFANPSAREPLILWCSGPRGHGSAAP